ncbi:MAG: ATP-binding protein [Ignavibacteria bacterium]
MTLSYYKLVKQNLNFIKIFYSLLAIFIFTSFQINSIKTFSTSDGLPDNRIIDIAQDKFGQLWVLANSSVSIYNGSYWKNFSTKFRHQENPFNDHLIDFHKILINEDDIKLFLSNDGRIFKLKENFLEELASPLINKGISLTDFVLVREKDKQIIWASTEKNGLAFYDNNWFTFTTNEGLISNTILAIKSNNDLLLILTDQGLQFIRDRKVVYTFKDFNFKKFRNIFIAFDRNTKYRENIPAFWVLADNRLYKFEEERVFDKTFNYFNPYKENYSKIFTNGGNKLYLLNNQLIKVINLATGEMQVLNKEVEITGTPQILFVDREKNLWIGTDKKLIRINFTNIIKYSEEDGLSSSKITSICKSEENFYLGHPDGKLTLFSSSKFYQLNFETQIKYYLKNYSISSLEVRKIQAKDNRIMFLAGKSGIFELYKNKFLKPVFLINNPSDYVNDFVLLKNGGLLLCGKFSQVDEVKNLIFINSNQSLPESEILRSIQPERLFISRDGAIWISTQTSILVRVFKNKVEQYDFKQICNAQKIYAINEDRGGNIFVGTDNGFIVLLKNGETKTYSFVDKMNSNENIEFYSFGFDELNNVWLLSSRGLKFWNWKEFKSSYEWKNVIPVKENFQAVEELKGKIFIASENGLFVISSIEDEIIDLQPQVYIQEIVANGNSYDGFTDLTFKETTNLSIKFNAVLLSANNIEFSYKLEGYDKEWSSPTFSREVNYFNLPEGNYRFVLRAKSSFTDWTQPISTGSIRVKIPIYQKFEIIVPFILLLVLLSLLVSVIKTKRRFGKQDLVALKRQIEGLEKQNKQLRLEFNKAIELSKSRMTFLASLSHELRTPINSLIGFVDILLDSKIKLSEEERQKYLNYISINSRRLLILINDIIDIAKIDSGTITLDYSEVNLNAEVRDTINLFREKIRSKHLDLILELDPDLETQYLYIDRNRLHQIISNLITNAVKFTEEGYIKILTRKEADNFILAIEDTGIGIPEKEINFIFEEFRRSSNAIKKSIEGTGLGLSITKRLVEMMGGEIKVESQEGVGSTFTVTFPSMKGSKKKLGSNINLIQN